MRTTTSLLAAALLSGCAATPSPRAPAAVQEEASPFVGRAGLERPRVRLAERTGLEVGPAAAQAMMAVRDVQDASHTASDTLIEVWCELAAVADANPERARATEACAEWRAYLAAVEELKHTVTTDVDALLAYVRLGEYPARERLRVADLFLRTYAPLTQTPHGRVGAAVRVALLTGKQEALEKGPLTRVEERSGLTRVWHPTPPPVENARPAHEGYWLDGAEVTVRAYRACVRAGECVAAADHGACADEPAATVSDALPVRCVTREQAEAFCAWTSGRMPTLAEWLDAGLPEEGFTRTAARGFRCAE
ncbi:SUMF1/EgtB/PvdO family nonheme iron enzyme [Myxococcaceae bacterium GXIMD 01537]